MTRQARPATSSVGLPRYASVGDTCQSVVATSCGAGGGTGLVEVGFGPQAIANPRRNQRAWIIAASVADRIERRQASGAAMTPATSVRAGPHEGASRFPPGDPYAEPVWET